jgi:hypothetical protein
MRDFLNFEIVEVADAWHSIKWVLRHKTREGLSVEFETGNTISAVEFPEIVKGMLRRYSDKYNSMARKPMTAAQKNYYDKLVEFHKMEGRAPSYDEQCLMLGVKSKGTPHHYAKTLVEAGWVWIDGRMVIPFDIAEPEIQDGGDHGE